jgi:hypothetical protein
VGKKLAAAEEEKKKMNARIQALEMQLEENKADANFSMFLGRVSMLKDIVNDKATYILGDQLATLRKEFPHHLEDIEEVFGQEQSKPKTGSQNTTNLVTHKPVTTADQEAHSDTDARN